MAVNEIVIVRKFPGVTLPQAVPVNTVTLPATPSSRSVQFSVFDAVADVSSPFTGQVAQTQTWPGGDQWGATLELPPLSAADASAWTCFLMELRGRANGVLLGDPSYTGPSGLGNFLALGPLVDGSVSANNAPGSTLLYTKNWVANSFRNLMPGDYLQLGYRLHRVLDPVDADGSGRAAINIWPSIREQPSDGDAVLLSTANPLDVDRPFPPRGLFRLAQNKREWSVDVTRLTRLSIAFVEYR